MTTIVEQQNKINELLNSGRPVTLETIAQALSVTAQEAAHLLPEGSATFAPGSDFESVWAAIAEWEKITFIVSAHGNVIEVETKLVTGKAAMGYYNLMGGKSPLQGHFKYGDISEIGFVTMPFMGRESHFAAFFTTSGEVATLMTCLLAGTGAGKSCVQKPIDFIMEDIRKRDQENLKREKEWKEEMMRKGANKDKRKRPENLIIQEIDADMTNPAFVMRTAEAKEHFLYTSLNEIDQFDALKGSGFQQFRIMCLAFDPGNLYGQTRVGTQSVTERVTIRFNWNASTTIHKGIRYFKRVLTDGPVSRINFCTIPERDIGEDIPVYGTYDEEFRNSLKPYIDNLCMASGLMECKEAFHLAEVLKDENAEFSRLSQDRVYENLSFRANVIGYLKACVLYVANGYQWEPEIEDFIRWSERYDLYCKMRFFGDAIKKAERDGDQESKKGPASILAFLPEKFSYQQVESLRLKNDMNAKGTAKMLRNWLHRGYIEKEESDSVTQKLSDSVYFKTHSKSGE